jgi:adenosylcobinamide kinase / adenosylcobinamide-phosphate guanylyltransferase
MTFLKASDRLILVTGPARSGKSEWAEALVQNLATQSGQSVSYVATASLDPSDAEWQARIRQHQQRRPPNWQTLNVPVALADTIRASSNCLLVDSLGSWLANLLDQDESTWNQTRQDLLASLSLASLSQTQAHVVLVAEETGWGVVPAYPIGRIFRDRLGQLTRQIGAIANPVYLVTGGHALNLSQLGKPLPDSSSLFPNA